MILFYLLTVIICGGYVLLLISYRIGWIKTTTRLYTPSPSGPRPSTLVSIILPVRNEEKNILAILNCLDKQTYPKDKFEIIVVDDFSEDKTHERLQQANMGNLRLVRLPAGAGKKKALAEGISKARGTLIVTTDADCEMGENWLLSIVTCYEEKKSKMIVAPVLLKGENKLQQIMQGQEMTVLTACACASIYYRAPILCSGANLAYEKEVFLSVNGFEGVDQTATGDDVFLMMKVHKKFPQGIDYLKSNEAVVFTHPERSSAGALRQRKRWASKGLSYGFGHITAIAALIFFTNFLILISGILSVINLKFVIILIAGLSAKGVVDYMLLYSASSFFGKRTYTPTFILATLIYPVYVTLMGLISPFTNYSWKGRKS